LQLHVCVETVWYEAVAKSSSTNVQFVKWLSTSETIDSVIVTPIWE